MSKFLKVPVRAIPLKKLRVGMSAHLFGPLPPPENQLFASK